MTKPASCSGRRASESGTRRPSKYASGSVATSGSAPASVEERPERRDQGEQRQAAEDRADQRGGAFAGLAAEATDAQAQTHQTGQQRGDAEPKRNEGASGRPHPPPA